jgi:hypothetical protein
VKHWTLRERLFCTVDLLKAGNEGHGERQEPIEVGIAGMSVMPCSRQDEASTASLSDEILLHHSCS